MITAYLKQAKTQLDRWGPRLAIKNMIYHILYRERRKTFGEKNPDLTFYVIRSVKSDSRFYLGVDLNLLANYSYAVSHIAYAKERGWIPIIDQLHYPVYNKEDGPINGTENPWEYFWRQPWDVTLEEVYQSKHVVLSKRSWYAPGNPEYSIEAHQDKTQITKYHTLMEEAPLNDVVRQYKESCKSKIFPTHGKVIGVPMRNGGHSRSSPYHAPGHPIQPEREELADIVGQRLKEWGADYVFLTTEENDNIAFFQRRFPNQIIYLPRERYNGWRIFTKEYPNPLYKSGKRYQTSLDYLVEMELLADCDALIGSITSGLRYAIFRNGGRYEHLEILDRGNFQDHNRKDR